MKTIFPFLTICLFCTNASFGQRSSKIDTSKVILIEPAEAHPNYDLPKYINEHLRYPQNGADAEGRVLVRFTVNENGSISDCVVVRGIEPGFDEEAVRVVKSLPKWIPKIQNGKAVKESFTVPVAFKLE